METQMENINNSGVYWIVNRANNKRYLGSTGNLKNRWAEHKRALRGGYHWNDHLQRAFQKCGEEKFVFEVVAYMDADKALAFEDYLLKNYPTMFEYNIARDATAPMRGHEHTEEAKAKMRGRVVSEKTREKIGDGNRGKIVSEEARKKIGDWNRGKVISDETRAKMSEAKSGEAQRGEKNPNFGKHPADETRRKLIEAKSGNKNPRYIDIPKEKIDEMQSLRNNGYSYRKIAGVFGVSVQTVWRRLNLS